MSDKELQLTEDELDYLEELMSIGAGNTTTALSQLLGCVVDMKIPEVHIISTLQVPTVVCDPFSSVVCVNMRMVGDVKGNLFFILPDEDKQKLMDLAYQAGLGQEMPKGDDDLSVLLEIGNIVAGVYLSAIYRFCEMNIYHTVPTLTIDMLQSSLDESIIELTQSISKALVVKHEFIIKKECINAFLMMIPFFGSVRALGDSIKQARLA